MKSNVMRSAEDSLRLLNICEVAPKTLRPLSHIEASTLSDALSTDAESISQAALATLADALLSVSGRRFTWATVKFYYAVFYSLKALIMLDGTSVFYRNTSPYSIRARPGERFAKRAGNSHRVIFSEFRSTYGNDVLLSQPIGGDLSLTWIERQRNIASYGTAPFPDPQIPGCFAAPYDRLRLYVNSYFDEKTPVYAFQEDHAIIAFPILSLKRLDQELTRRQKSIQIDAHYTTILTNAGCDVTGLKSLKAFAMA